MQFLNVIAVLECHLWCLGHSFTRKTKIYMNVLKHYRNLNVHSWTLNKFCFFEMLFLTLLITALNVKVELFYDLFSFMINR